jgi:hypothetical protein
MSASQDSHNVTDTAASAALQRQLAHRDYLLEEARAERDRCKAALAEAQRNAREQGDLKAAAWRDADRLREEADRYRDALEDVVALKDCPESVAAAAAAALHWKDRPEGENAC